MSQSDLDTFKGYLKSIGFKVASIDPAPGADYKISFKNIYNYTGSITYITMDEGFVVTNYTTNSDKFEELFVEYFAEKGMSIKEKLHPFFINLNARSDLRVLRLEVDYYLVELNDLLKSRVIDDESILLVKNILTELSAKINVLEGVNK
ncbi:hypothetical protein ACI2JA_03205 [Alkalihalobacillus sp. NPDC078783]